jgi:hypothetical protein
MSTAFKRNLELISLVNNNYEHIQQFETLIEAFKLMKESEYSLKYPNEFCLTKEQIDSLIEIVINTHNSHYDYKLYLDTKYQNSDLCIHNVLAKYGIKQLPSFKDMYYDIKINQ